MKKKPDNAPRPPSIFNHSPRPRPRAPRLDAADAVEKAFARTAREREALPQASVRTANADVTSIVVAGLAALRKIASLRVALSELPSRHVKTLDRFDTYALALEAAQIKLDTYGGVPDDLPELAREGAALRTGLLVAAAALAHKGIIAPQSFAARRGWIGYKNVASDLLLLAMVFDTGWEKIAGRTAVEPSEVARARLVAMAIYRALAARDQAPMGRNKRVDDRNRAFTLFMNAYEELRAAVRYLRRREGDADEIAPSLYSVIAPRPKAATQDGAPLAAPATGDAGGHDPAAAPPPPALPAAWPAATVSDPHPPEDDALPPGFEFLPDGKRRLH